MTVFTAMESFQGRYARMLDVGNLPNSIPFKIGLALAVTVALGVVVMLSLGTTTTTTKGISGERWMILKSEENIL